MPRHTVPVVIPSDQWDRTWMDVVLVFAWTFYDLGKQFSRITRSVRNGDEVPAHGDVELFD